MIDKLQEMETRERLEKALEEVGSQIERGQPLSSDANFSIEDLDVLYSLGYGLYEAGDWKGAKTIFHQLVLSNPLEKKYWLGLGSALQMDKKFQEALTPWSMSALLEDEDPLPHFHAAECLLSLGEKGEAAKALKAARDRISDDLSSNELSKKIEVMEQRL